MLLRPPCPPQPPRTPGCPREPSRSSSPTSRAAPGSGNAVRPTRCARRSPATTRCCARPSSATAARLQDRGRRVLRGLRRGAAALAAALDAQRALAREPWPGDAAASGCAWRCTPARPRLRDGDYFGPPLNRVARLLAAGHGGQVLLSLRDRRSCVRDSLPPGVTLRDLGEHRLRDLIRPERVYQVVAPDCRPSSRRSGTLDARAAQPAGAADQLRRPRARDAGGQGSSAPASRLCHADRAPAAPARRAWRCRSRPISSTTSPTASGSSSWRPLADARVVAQTVATTLGLKEEPGVPLAATLTAGPRRTRSCCWCSTIASTWSAPVRELARRCCGAAPACAILATSREALRIAGEATYRVPSLPAPDPRRRIARRRVDAVSTPCGCSSTARWRCSPDFAVDNANAPAVASICHRARRHSAGDRAGRGARARRCRSRRSTARLDQRFRLLTGGVATALPRQQTLRATIDWSYDLLSATEQACSAPALGLRRRLDAGRRGGRGLRRRGRRGGRQ